MCHHIRLYMGQVDGDAPMGGPNFDGDPVVEIDHTFIGGHDREGYDDKHVVLGIVERGGDVISRQVPNARQPYTLPVIAKYDTMAFRSRLNRSSVPSEDFRPLALPEARIWVFAAMAVFLSYALYFCVPYRYLANAERKQYDTH